MIQSRSRRVFAVLPFVLAAGVLAACTAAPSGPDDAANDAAAAKFVACLTGQGQTAKIITGGQVGLLLPESSEDDGGVSLGTQAGGDPGESMTAVAVFMDEDGAWMAASDAEGYPEEGGMREAWTACESEVPEFEQPAPDMSGAEVQSVSREDVIESSLAFAECARGEGYADFPDPDENGMLDFPSGMTEDGFRSLLEACLDEDAGIGLPISQESAESFDFDWLSVMLEFGGGGMTAVTPAEPVN